MKLFLVAAAATSIGTALPPTVLAQDAPAQAQDDQVARTGMHDQSKLLDAPVDRDLAQGRLSGAEADRVHREVSA